MIANNAKKKLMPLAHDSSYEHQSSYQRCIPFECFCCGSSSSGSIGPFVMITTFRPLLNGAKLDLRKYTKQPGVNFKNTIQLCPSEDSRALWVFLHFSCVSLLTCMFPECERSLSCPLPSWQILQHIFMTVGSVKVPDR